MYSKINQCRIVAPFGLTSPGSYNRLTLRHLRVKILSLALVAWSLSLPLHGQTPGTQTLVVMPFNNQSSAPGLEWIGEGFAEVLSQRMASPRLYAISRDDRAYAFD